MRDTVPTFPASLGEVLASGDAAATNPDVARTRAHLTVAQAVEAEEREAVRRSVDAQFPVVAAFLAADTERPASHPLAQEVSADRVRFLEDMRARHARMLEGASPAVVTWVGRLEEYAASQKDPAATLATVAEAVRQERRCTVYDWCTERGDHGINHVSAAVSVTAPGAQAPYVDARLIGFGPGTEFIGFCESDLTPSQAREEAAKLRTFAGRLEALADAIGGGR